MSMSPGSLCGQSAFENSEYGEENLSEKAAFELGSERGGISPVREQEGPEQSCGISTQGQKGCGGHGHPPAVAST